MAHGGGVLPNMGPRAALHGAHHGSLVGAAVTHAFQLPLQHIYYPTTLPSTYDFLVTLGNSDITRESRNE